MKKKIANTRRTSLNLRKKKIKLKLIKTKNLNMMLKNKMLSKIIKGAYLIKEKQNVLHHIMNAKRYQKV